MSMRRCRRCNDHAGSYYSPHGVDTYSKGELGMDSEASLGGLEDVLVGQTTASSGQEDCGASTPSNLPHLNSYHCSNSASPHAGHHQQHSHPHHHHHHQSHSHHHLVQLNAPLGEPGNNEQQPSHAPQIATTGQMTPPGATSNASVLFAGSMTPIDKLYSMQNSYFKSSECECLGTVN